MVAWVKRRDIGDVFEAVPFQRAPRPPMTDRLAAECAQALHVLGADGTVLKGGRASLFILGRIGWPRLARVLGAPPFIWVVELGYRLVAANRGLLSRAFVRSPSDGCPVDTADRGGMA